MDPSGSFSPKALAQQQVAGAGEREVRRGGLGLRMGSPPAVPLPSTPPPPPTVPRGHCFGACQWESPILKHFAIFNPWPLPPRPGAPCSGGTPGRGSLPAPSSPRRWEAAPLRPASPAGGERSHRLTRANSRSHWLLPVANPRDRRRRAPPRAPPPRAPAPRRVPAGGAGQAALAC